MDYIIRRTDPTNGQFTIKPYTTNGPLLPVNATPLDPNATSANTSLILLGQGMHDYGEIIASDFVHLLENFSGPVAPVYPVQGQLWYKNDTGNLYVYDNGSFTTQSVIIDGKLTASLNVNTNKIINVGAPTVSTDAATKGYVDTTAVLLTGGTLLSGANLTFVGGGEVLGLPATPTTAGSAASKAYVDAQFSGIQAVSDSRYVYKSGDTMTGSLTMSLDNHIFLPTPTVGFSGPTEVVNKAYVDSLVTGSTAFVRRAGDTMTGELIINGQSLYYGATLTVISANSVGNTIDISGGDFTASFTSGMQFGATLDATVYTTLTVLLAAYNVGPNTTTITTVENINTATGGTVYRIFGLALSTNAGLSVDGDLIITGSRNIDFGTNILHNIDTPLAANDAANKGYVDSAVAAGITPDGTLVSVTFADNALTFTSSVGAPIVVTGIGSALEEDIASEVLYDANTNTSFNSVIRDTFLGVSLTYPAVSTADAISTLDTKLSETSQAFARYMFPIAYEVVSAVSVPHAALLITAVTTGVSGTFTVAGDYTTSFLPGILLTVSGNTGVPTTTQYTVVSSTFGGVNTVITVTNIGGAVTPDGSIDISYGAIGVNGNVTYKFTHGSIINLSSNTGGSNGNYTLTNAFQNLTGTVTFLYADSTTPFPIGTTGDGNVLTRDLVVYDAYVVESNKINVHRQGIKQYCDTRGTARIFLPIASEIAPTNLPAGIYSFSIAVDGALPQTISINVAYTSYTITAVDTSTKTWTITGAPVGYLSQFDKFTVTGNVGLGVNTEYTVHTAVLSGVDTLITVYESIGPADVSGTVHTEYTFDNLFHDIQTQFNAAFINPPKIVIRDNNWYVYSPTSGVGSSITITDVNLITSVSPRASITTVDVGANYGYTEVGYPFDRSSIIRLPVLPTIGEVYEIINKR